MGHAIATHSPVQHPPADDDRILSLAAALRPSGAELDRARRRLHAKAVVIVALAASSYGVLVFAEVAVPARLAAALVLVVAVVAVGTGIMHDANHGAFCRTRRGNRIVAHSADVMGASSWVWRYKHNTLHHAGTNVVGVDSDIDQAPFARLAPDQPWRPWHRYQHLYLWALYGLLTTKWFLLSDLAALRRGGFGANRFPRPPRRREVAVVAAGKAVHLVWALAVPLLFHPWWAVLAYYLACSWLVGFVLALVFQLAHCTDEVTFPGPEVPAGVSFELRQLATTADIATPVPVVGAFARWLMGGLDHQIEHHLAPRLPHTIYPVLAPRLQARCAERGIPYRRHAGVWAALRAHGRWLEHLGRGPGAGPRST